MGLWEIIVVNVALMPKGSRLQKNRSLAIDYSTSRSGQPCLGSLVQIWNNYPAQWCLISRLSLPQCVTAVVQAPDNKDHIQYHQYMILTALWQSIWATFSKLQVQIPISNFTHASLLSRRI